MARFFDRTTQVVLVAAAIIALSCCVAARSGRIGSASSLYLAERATRNPHPLDVSRTGSCEHGTISLRARDPSTYRLTTDMGHNGQDNVFNYITRGGKVFLQEIVYNPDNHDPAPFGSASNITRYAGECRGNRAYFFQSFIVSIVNDSVTPPELVHAESDNIISLKFKGTYTTGNIIGISVPWSSRLSALGRSGPYQVLVTEADIDTRYPISVHTSEPYGNGIGVKNLLRAHRCFSINPAAATQPFSNPGPVYVAGEITESGVSDKTENFGLLQGLLSARTGAQLAHLGDDIVPGLGNLVFNDVPIRGVWASIDGENVGTLPFAIAQSNDFSETFYVLVGTQFVADHDLE